MGGTHRPSARRVMEFIWDDIVLAVDVCPESCEVRTRVEACRARIEAALDAARERESADEQSDTQEKSQAASDPANQRRGPPPDPQGRLAFPDTQLVSALAVSPDGQLVAAATTRKLFVWKWLEGEEPVEIEGLERASAVAFAPDGRKLAVARDRFDGGPGLVLWDCARQTVAREFGLPGVERVRAGDLVFSRDGTLLAVPMSLHRPGTKESALLVWGVETGQLVRRLPLDTRRPAAAAISRDQRLIAAISDGEIAVWDLKTGQRRADSLVGHTGIITCLRFTPDRKQIITGSDEGTARVWDAETGKPLGVLEHDYWIRAMSISPDGKWIATSSLDDTVRLWNRVTRAEVYRLPGHGSLGGRRTIEFTPPLHKIRAEDRVYPAFQVENCLQPSASRPHKM
ncbi:MAG: WD40 repeat domain-containing protein [Planctomycetota bacterium]